MPVVTRAQKEKASATGVAIAEELQILEVAIILLQLRQSQPQQRAPGSSDQSAPLAAPPAPRYSYNLRSRRPK